MYPKRSAGHRSVTASPASERFRYNPLPYLAFISSFFADTEQGDWFGESVAISGDTVVVGSPRDDDVAGGNQGSAYVFAYNGEVWIRQQKLRASDAAAGDGFGSSVAISGDAVVVGAPADSGATGFIQASTYVFARSGGVWSQQQKLLPSDAAPGDEFGWSVAISGETVVFGAPDDEAPLLNQGSAYVAAFLTLKHSLRHSNGF